MILPCVVENVQARDWFTVMIEFLIVVVGIFVGLEDSNWNEEGKSAAQERSYLVQIRDDFNPANCTSPATRSCRTAPSPGRFAGGLGSNL